MNKFLLILFLLPLYAFSSTPVGPNNGATFSNVVIAGSTSTWTNPGNVQTSDNTYASNTTSLSSNGDYTDYIQVTNFGFSIPLTASIDGIVVEVERWNTGTKNVKDSKVKIVEGSVIGGTDKSAGGNWAMSDPNTYVTYGNATDLWGNTWTPADINGSGFGIAISAARSGGGGASADPRIDNIRITVYYTDPLPIELLSFTGEASGNKNELKWSVATQFNNDYFTIERSTDTFNWQELANIRGAGSSSQKLDYTCSDPDPSVGTYYRLSQTDYNGTRKYFDIISVINSAERILIFPNPFNESIVITGIPNPRVIITDGLGYKMEFISNKINTSSFPAGYYIIDIFLGDRLMKRGVFIK